jgi:hypothetical protein
MKGLIKKIGIATVLFFSPVLAFAQSTQSNGPAPAAFTTGTPPPSVGINSVQSVLDLFCTVFGWMFYFLVALAVIFGAVAAFRFLTSSGESEKIKNARNTLLYAAIAVAVALLARAIPLIVADFLGANGDVGACSTL